MAEYLSLGPVDPNTAMWLRDAVRAGEAADDRRTLDPAAISRIAGDTRSGRYVGGRFGDDAAGPRAARHARDVKRRLHEVTGQTLQTLTEPAGTRRPRSSSAAPLPADQPHRGQPVVSRAGTAAAGSISRPRSARTAGAWSSCPSATSSRSYCFSPMR